MYGKRYVDCFCSKIHFCVVGLLDAMENALVIGPGKPCEMDTEKSEDEDENEEEEDMVLMSLVMYRVFGRS